MNDQQILEFIAVKQPIRAVQLADKFDKSEREASEALRALVDIGDLVRTAGTGPNNHPAQFYTLSEQFRKSHVGKLLIARIESAPAPTSAPPASAEVAPATAAANKPAAPAEAAATTAGINRAEVGVAYILKLGSVPDSDLRQVMGLRAGQYPSAWLGAAVKRGDVNKDGKNWTPGRGVEVRKQPAFGGSLGLPGATPQPKPVEIPTFLAAKSAKDVDDAPAAPPEAAITADASDTAMPPTFRCGLWSDGVLELQRNGVTVAELEQEEGVTVAAFMARLRQPLEAA